MIVNDNADLVNLFIKYINIFSGCSPQTAAVISSLSKNWSRVTTETSITETKKTKKYEIEISVVNGYDPVISVKFYCN